MFTIYQPANTIIYDLPKLIIQYLQQQQHNFEPKVIVISDLLDMFVNDPHIKVEEAINLLKEIIVSILRTRRRREMLGNSLIVMSLPYHHQQQQSLSMYNKILLPRFDKRIEAFNSASKANSVDIKIVNRPQSKAYSSNSNINSTMLSLERTELLSVSRVEEIC